MLAVVSISCQFACIRNIHNTCVAFVVNMRSHPVICYLCEMSNAMLFLGGVSFVSVNIVQKYFSWFVSSMIYDHYQCWNCHEYYRKESCFV